jgi:hypothetical protein
MNSLSMEVPFLDKPNNQHLVLISEEHLSCLLAFRALVPSQLWLHVSRL